MRHLLYIIVLAFPAILFLTGAAFAQTDGEQGIKFYNQGDLKGAIAILKNTKDVRGLYYLGLANEKVGETGEAKDAFKKSFTKSYDFFLEKFSEWHVANTPDAKKNILDLLKETEDNNATGLSAAEKAFNIKSDIFQINEWRIKAKVLLDATNLAKANEKIYPSSDKSISNAKIAERFLIPFPKYSDGAPLARRNQSPNKPILVKVFIIFGADGTLKLLMPMDEMIDIYTAQVLSGIQKFKFQPATKDGKPVAYHTKLQYSFTTR